MEIIREVGTLTKRIGAFARLGKKWAQEARVLALSTLVHAATHGDITLATRLVNAMPAGARKAAMVDWFENFAPVRWSQKQQCFEFPKPYGEVKDKFDLTGAEATPFDEFTPDRSTKELTIEQVIKTLRSRLKTLRDEKRLDTVGLSQVRSVLDEFNSIAA